MTAVDRFARLPQLLAADSDLLRRGRWLIVDCRVDIGHEPFFLSIRDGALAAFERGAKLMRSTAFAFRGSDEAWSGYWTPVPEPGWHDLLALTKRTGLREYGLLAQRYVLEFDRKWLRGGAAEDEAFVGSADIQSLADLGNSFEIVSGMKLVYDLINRFAEDFVWNFAAVIEPCR